MCRGFLKKQVKEYLASHIKIAPKAVILEALLLDEALEDATDVPNETSGSLLREILSFNNPYHVIHSILSRQSELLMNRH